MAIYIVYSFYKNITQAKKIARKVINNKLAACVNINNDINSIFIWKNKICDEKEIELSFKTNKKNVKPLIKFLESNHPYECPSIIALPTYETNNAFSIWVKNNTI